VSTLTEFSGELIFGGNVSMGFTVRFSRAFQQWVNVGGEKGWLASARSSSTRPQL